MVAYSNAYRARQVTNQGSKPDGDHEEPRKNSSHPKGMATFSSS